MHPREWANQSVEEGLCSLATEQVAKMVPERLEDEFNASINLMRMNKVMQKNG
jgi:hypothetical protein